MSTNSSTANPKLLGPEIENTGKTESPKNGFSNCSLTFWLAITAVVLGGAFQFGYALGVVANTMAVIQTKFNASDLYISAIVSGNSIGGLVGALLTGYIADTLGRTRGIILNVIPFVVGSILMAASTHQGMLLVGRIVVGFGVGLSSGLTNIFLCEVAPVAVRGFVGMLFGVVLTVGTLVSLLISTADVMGTGDVGWRLVFAFPIFPALFQTFVLLFCPEPPPYLAFNKQDTVAATTALQQYRKIVVKEEEEGLAQCDTPAVLSLWQLLSHPGHRLALIIGIGLHSSQQLSAINVVMSYTPTIFDQANVSNTAMATIGTGLVNVASAAIASLFTDRLGRRLLMLLGLMMTAVAHVSLAVSQSCATGVWSCQGDWNGKLAIASVFLFIIGFAGSVGSIPWLIVNEITAPEARGKTNSICVGINWSWALVILLSYDSIVKALGSYTFFIFGGIAVLWFVFTLLLMPETRKKTVQEISRNIKAQAEQSLPFVPFSNTTNRCERIGF